MAWRAERRNVESAGLPGCAAAAGPGVAAARAAADTRRRMWPKSRGGGALRRQQESEPSVTTPTSVPLDTVRTCLSPHARGSAWPDPRSCQDRHSGSPRSTNLGLPRAKPSGGLERGMRPWIPVSAGMTSRNGAACSPRATSRGRLLAPSEVDGSPGACSSPCRLPPGACSSPVACRLSPDPYSSPMLSCNLTSDTVHRPAASVPVVTGTRWRSY